MLQKQPYIKVNNIYRKLKNAQEKGFPLYIHAPAGCGKTEAVKYYYRNKDAYYYLSGNRGFLEHMPSVNKIKESVIVVDDISWITDTVSQDYILHLLHTKDKHILLIGRSKLPKWLVNEYISQDLATADENDFVMDISHVKRFMEAYGISEDEDVAQVIIKISIGYPLIIKMLVLQLKKEGVYSKILCQQALIDCYHYYDIVFYEQWDDNMCNLLLAVTMFEQFDIEFAIAITSDYTVPAILEYAFQIGDFIIQDENGKYHVRPLLSSYLEWKRKLIWTEEDCKSIHNKAAFYYEEHNRIVEALEQSVLAGNENQMIKLLIYNSNNHPGTAHFYETRQFYFALPESKIKQNPVLMAGMSILYSMMLQPEKSDEWYENLVEYAKNTINKNKCKEAKSRIAYLDIALPQKGIHNIISIIKNLATLCINRKISLPEFSVTSNLPSIMNGGKDFCEWSKHDKELAKIMKKPVEIVLGKYGVGLANIALAESSFEKSSMEDYEIMSLAQSGSINAKINGKIEMVFAAVGIQVKIHIEHYQPELAKRMLKDMYELAENNHQSQLFTNIEAMLTWIALQVGDKIAVENWIKDSPNENVDFYILDRYRYMIKLRYYIAKEEYSSAWNLSEQLNYYYTKYERTYYWIENMVLRAIISYRLKRPQWKEIFQSALNKAKEYHFLWLIAQEGIAIKPLLEKMDLPDDEYNKQLMKKTIHMAFQYPRYLTKAYELAEPLTEMEKNILRFHCEGMNTNEILEICKISLRTLKFHNSNIYRKLGVKNKQEAIFAARKIGYIK